jgi:hypothetical protein
MRPPQWEYKSVQLDVAGWFTPDVQPEALDAALNEQGAGRLGAGERVRRQPRARAHLGGRRAVQAAPPLRVPSGASGPRWLGAHAAHAVIDGVTCAAPPNVALQLPGTRGAAAHLPSPSRAGIFSP